MRGWREEGVRGGWKITGYTVLRLRRIATVVFPLFSFKSSRTLSRGRGGFFARCSLKPKGLNFRIIIMFLKSARTVRRTRLGRSWENIPIQLLATTGTELRSCVNIEVAVPNSPCGLDCGRKATGNVNSDFRAQVLCESRGGRPGLPVPNSP